MGGYYLILLIAMFFLSWLVVILLVPPVIKLAKRYELVDKPSARKVHQVPTPRVGGIALFTAFIIPFTIFYAGLCYKLQLPLSHVLSKPDWLGLLAGGSLAFLTGLIDDITGLTPGIKLMGQTLAALCACFGGLTVKEMALPLIGPVSLGWLSIPVTVLWFLTIINGFNLLDGVDGLATTLTFTTGFFLLLYCLQNNREYLALPAVIIMGIGLGFLHFNMNPASIFMGDSGSHFLGFQLAALALKACASEGGIANPAVPLLIFFVPLVDVAMAMVRRILRGHGIFNPDTDHIHHCLLRKGFSQNRILLIIGSATALTSTVGLISPYLNPLADLCLFGVVALLSLTSMAHIGYLSCFRENPKNHLFYTAREYTRFILMLWKYRMQIHRAREYESLIPPLVKALNSLQPELARLELLHQPQSFSKALSEGYKNTVKSTVEISTKAGLNSNDGSALTLNIPLIVNNMLFGTFLIKNVPGIRNIPYRFILWYLHKVTHYLTAAILRINMESEKMKLVPSEEDAISCAPKKQVYVLIQAKGKA